MAGKGPGPSGTSKLSVSGYSLSGSRGLYLRVPERPRTSSYVLTFGLECGYVALPLSMCSASKDACRIQER